jgi:hypothetical protein
VRFDPKGLPAIVAVVLVVADFVLQFFPQTGFLHTAHPLLYLGIVLGLLGLLIGDSL